MSTSGQEVEKLKRWVVKVGSQVICAGGPILMRAWMQQVATLRKNHGIEVIWVSSGAIATAIEKMDYKKEGERELAEKQALSAIGQPSLMDLYNLSLHSVGMRGAQILITYSDIGDQNRCTNLRNTLEKLLEWKVVPILNENDAVSTDEIRFGDNDSLSAKVAGVMKADRLIIMTDVDGLHDKNPAVYSDAKMIEELTEVSDATLSKLQNEARSAKGTGGIYSKLLAAKEASAQGIETWLVRGDRPHVLVQAAENQKVGTRVTGKKS